MEKLATLTTKHFQITGHLLPDLQRILVITMDEENQKAKCIETPKLSKEEKKKLKMEKKEIIKAEK